MAKDFIQRIKDLPQQKLVLLAAQLQERLEEAESRSPNSQPIAIVGVGCRFPGGIEDPETYWDFLVAGRDAITEVPADRWDAAALFDPDYRAEGKMATKWGGFLDGIDRFDARLFGISPREAVSLDPQQRLLLEVSWQALERAGIAPSTLAGSRTGVFVGISSSDYSALEARRGLETIDGYLASGSAMSVASGRLAYTLGLNGPALSVDTACSSSLVAVHLAVQSLRAGQCDAAIAGGVNVILSPTTSIALSKAQMMAADGHCKTFSADADGFVRGEGCGVIILKRLADAQLDGDPIVGVIRGTAINQDGRSNGLTAPNGPAQEAVISAALADAGIRGADIGYVEAHGTGTRLGDPIEVQALGAVLGQGRSSTSRLKIGSAKTNFGHLESAAGIAGLIKAMIVVEKGVIPPHRNLTELSPVIPWGSLPIDVPTENTPWLHDQPRFAGVSSFGFSGTNAHVILQAPILSERSDVVSPKRSVEVVALSAQSAEALDELKTRHGEHLATHDEDLAAVARVLNTGRDTFAYREAFIVDSTAQLRDELLAPRSEFEQRRSVRAHVQATRPARPVWLFTGQGSQYAGMGRELFESEPVFASVIEQCHEYLSREFGIPLLDVMWPSDPQDVRIHQTEYTQPALFSLQVALSALWKSWGVQPAAVVGHSVGEFAAAHVAGLFDLNAGLSLIATRGRLMQAAPAGGRMVALLASPQDIEPALAPQREFVSIAALNGPVSTVISGDAAHVQAVLDAVGPGFETRDLDVSHAFHSPAMDGIMADFGLAAAGVTFHEPQVPIVSNLFGQTAGLDRLGTVEYWQRQIREPVQFGPAMAGLMEEGHRLFLEIGPQPTLSGMAARAFGDAELQWVHSLRKDRSEQREIATALARLWTAGVAIDWRSRHGDATNPKPILPTYPMQRTRYWAEGVGPWDTDPVHAQPKPASNENHEPGGVDLNGLLYEIDWQPSAHPSVRNAAPSSFLTPVATTAAQLDAIAADIAAANGTAAYDEFLPRLDALCAAYVLDAMRKLGLDLRTGDSYSFDALVQKLKIVRPHHRLLKRMMGMLSEDRWLRAETDAWIVIRSDQPSPQVMHAELADRFPAFAAELDLINRCGTQMTGILRGQVDALQVLFPGGSTAQMDAIYRNLPIARAFNELVARGVAAAVAAMPAGRRLRILEVGAGSGATTDAVMAALHGIDVDYLFTDISPAFTIRARERYAAIPSVRFGTFDATLNPASQGLTPASFDLIIAANVIHATPNLSTTLTNLKHLLDAGGQLVLLEATTRERFSDLTVGLTQGWWSFEDTDLRPDYALLNADQWCSLLADLGFDSPVAAPGRASEPSLRREAVVMSVAPGVPAGLVEAQPSLPTSQHWAVIGEGPLADALVGELTSSGDSVSRLGAGDRDTVAALMSTSPPDSVVLTIESPDSAGTSIMQAPDVDESHQRHRQIVATMLGTVQGMLDAATPKQLSIVTRSAQAVGDTSVDDADAATAWGFSHVVDLEHPELHCRRIDVGDAELSDLAQSIAFELHQPDREETQLALRGRTRLVRRLVRSDAATSAPVELDPSGSYVVSGGLRGIGLLVAKWLVQHGARNLVLFGRQEPEAEVVAELDTLRTAGTTIVIERADAAIDADVRRVVQAAEALGQVRGVIHNAGTLSDASLMRQDWQRFEAVYGPKVFGTQALLRHLDLDHLDFLVLFASGAGVAGSAGQANHAAANAYLDALASRLRKAGLPAASIDWGAWTQVGAAVEHGIDKAPGAFSPQQGLAALQHIIGRTMQRQGPSQVIVRSSDWSDVIARFEDGGEPPLYRDLVRSIRHEGMAERDGGMRSPKTVDKLVDKLRDLPERRRRGVMRDEVRRLAARVLDIEQPDQIEIGQPLHDLGLDSLMAVELRNLLGLALGRDLPATLLFEHPSVSALVDHLLEEYVHLEDVADRGIAASIDDKHAGVAPVQTEAMSTDQIADLLAARLNRLGRGES